MLFLIKYDERGDLTNYKKHNIETVRICVNITKESYEKLEKILSKNWNYNRSSLVDKMIAKYKDEEG